MIARIHAALGDVDLAFHFLETAFNEHDVDLAGIACDPRLKLISNDPRFAALTAKISLSGRLQAAAFTA